MKVSFSQLFFISAAILYMVLLASSATIVHGAGLTLNNSLWTYEDEMEFSSGATVGQSITRSNASQHWVHGQFGADESLGWPAKAGEVTYADITMPTTNNLSISIHYSKHSAASVPIEIYLDDEATPRATFVPQNQGSWNQFVWSDKIALGAVSSGLHSIRLYTGGQRFGVADLDQFRLEALPIPDFHLEREAEGPDSATVGITIPRSGASERAVHGQFGTRATTYSYVAQAGEIQYTNLNIPALCKLFLKLRYSKNTVASTPIEIYLDDEATPRASFVPVNQGDWNVFTWSESIDLGFVDQGSHTLTLRTAGQQYGVVDLDAFQLSTIASRP